jgi:CRISPR-associated protein Csd1
LREQERARGPIARCLVTGTRGPKADRHTYLKGVPGGQSSGWPLVTFNKAAFWSYGLSGNNNAPIGQEAAEAYAAGLNRLLDNKPSTNDGRQLQRQNLLLSADTIALFWSREQTDLSWLLTLADSPDSVREMLRAPHTGRRSVLEDPAAFFTLVLSGAQSRTIVRSFLATQTQNVARNVDLYLEHASIVRPFREAAGTYPLRDLLRSLAALGDIERLAPDLGTQVYLAAISGRPLPRAVLEAAIRRTRADGPGSSRPDSTEAHQRLLAFAARCSLIRASLVRQRTFKEEPTVSLDSKNQQPAYLLGRVLAIVDAIQRDALGPRVNATLVDRYYGSASSTPAAVFPTLLRHSQHHLSKLRKEKAGLAVVRERLLQEATGGLQVFPKTMNLEAQGLFALGFHHQRQALFEKKAPETITN